MIASIIRGVGALIKSGTIFRLYSLLGLGTAIIMCFVNKASVFEMIGDPLAYVFIVCLAPVLAYSDRKSREYNQIVPKLLVGRTGVNIIGAVVFYVFVLLFLDFFYLM